MTESSELTCNMHAVYAFRHTCVPSPLLLLYSLTGNGINEVVVERRVCCIKPPLKHNAKTTITWHKKTSLFNHSVSFVQSMTPFSGFMQWIFVAKGKSLRSYMTCLDFWGHGYRMNSWDPDAGCSDMQGVQRCRDQHSITAWLYQRPPLCEVRQRGRRCITSIPSYVQSVEQISVYKTVVGDVYFDNTLLDVQIVGGWVSKHTIFAFSLQ